jgi:peptide methionine sulfoxide reductase MsrB
MGLHRPPFFSLLQVVWANVRVLRDGEAVSVDGTHLGHDLPDRTGHRYCINLVSVAGHPV